MNISDGDEAVFRYVKSEEAWKEINVACVGKGNIRIFMDGRLAGSVTADGDRDKISSFSGKIQMPAGQYELALRFEKTEALEIIDIIIL